MPPDLVPDRAEQNDVARGTIAVISDSPGRLLLPLRDNIPGIV